jgi:predicted O-methyltransferase YrrM
LVETIRGKVRARAAANRGFALADRSEHLCTVSQALAYAFGVSPEDCRVLAARVRVPSAPPGSAWGGGPDILQLTGSVVLLRRPLTVVETGVAMGFSTAVILAALRDNDAGVLHSIDLPPLQVDAASYVGEAVPRELRDRWTLHVGPARTVLPRLLRELPPVDLFVHDSDHSYAAQYQEYGQAWPHLARGACLISDDVCNPAFTDFAEQVGERPYLIAPPGHDAAVGLLVKTR